ncbi:MAG TPA: hypothetical protein VEA99_08225 [Gemmatimonadaceae bacterium]|nr:hypothetical protein [Gemmatimonadaceae bacterium]
MARALGRTLGRTLVRHGRTVPRRRGGDPALGWGARAYRRALAQHVSVVRAEATAREWLRLQDSVNQVLAAAAARAVVRQDSIVRVVRAGVTRWRVDTAWRRNTLYLAGDTARTDPRVAVPVAALERADSTIRACSALATSCETTRQALEAQIAGLLAEQRIREAAPVRVGSSTVPDSLRWRWGWSGHLDWTTSGGVALAAAAARYAYGRRGRPPAAIAASAHLVRRWGRAS